MGIGYVATSATDVQVAAAVHFKTPTILQINWDYLLESFVSFHTTVVNTSTSNIKQNYKRKKK